MTGSDPSRAILLSVVSFTPYAIAACLGAAAYKWEKHRGWLVAGSVATVGIALLANLSISLQTMSRLNWKDDALNQSNYYFTVTSLVALLIALLVGAGFVLKNHKKMSA